MKKIKIIKIVFYFLLVGLIFFVAYNKINFKSNGAVKKEYISHELFGNYYDQADLLLENMSLEEKVGQLFLVGYDSELASKQVKEYHPGGFILFAKDFENHTKDSIKSELSSLQKNSNIPLALGVDEEGGYVVRVSKFTNFRNERFESPRNYYDQGGYELLETVEKDKANLLLSLGLNLNLAPVADISTDEKDFIYNRSFGMDAHNTSLYIKNMVKYANESGISSTLKHFPGYGNNVDTHTGVAIDNRSYDEFLTNDFLPFESGIEEKVPVILVSHNIINCIDQQYPATLSKKVIDILRKDLNFSGLVITDDLSMDAVSKYVNDGTAAELAINAGNDMIITFNFEEMYYNILEAVQNKSVDIDAINTAVRRILAWKLSYGIMEEVNYDY